jgi:hypothetical protein
MLIKLIMMYHTLYDASCIFNNLTVAGMKGEKPYQTYGDTLQKTPRER